MKCYNGVIKIFIICALADKFFPSIDYIYFIAEAFLAPLPGMSFMPVPSSGVKKCQQAFLAPLPGTTHNIEILWAKALKYNLRSEVVRQANLCLFSFLSVDMVILFRFRQPDDHISDFYFRQLFQGPDGTPDRWCKGWQVGWKILIEPSTLVRIWRKRESSHWHPDKPHHAGRERFLFRRGEWGNIGTFADIHA